MSNLLVRLPPSISYTAPIGLAILKAITPEFKCLDFSSIQEMEKENPEIIGFHVNEFNYLNSCLASKNFHKRGIKIIWGGAGTRFRYKNLEKFDFIDNIIVGEAENVWKEALKSEKKIIFQKYVDMDRIPIPDYSDFNMSKYDTIGIETQRGCINRCLFCNVRFLPSDEQYKEKSIEKIREEVRELKKYKKPFYFCDNITNPTKERLINLCKMLYKENIKWHSEFIPKIDEEEAYWLNKSGCFMASLGIESMVDSCLKKMNKPIKLKDILSTIKNLKKNNIKVHGMFFFGFPDESIKEAILSFFRIIKHRKYFDIIAIGNYEKTEGSLMNERESRLYASLFKKLSFVFRDKTKVRR